ncbi:ABC transporter permease [Mannheimia granulomatis]|uniref:ABC transporter permease n=1 Tax=Mannheimia granulomatis TaxID=85402 RepID=UPI00159E795E|nr:ABC transporter permease [Mannheimia granulomatis]QLB15055.1 ABC transporter permease [Mannheimia granulomatis]
MQIKFADLLQDSWNFMRNQQRFSLTAVAIIVIIQLAVIFLFPHEPSSISQQQIDSRQIELSNMLPTILLGVANFFISLLMILNIQSINNGYYRHFFQHTAEALKAFFPVLLLNFAMILPLSLGGSIVIGSAEMMILAFPMIIIGFYWFFKLCLVIYVYLLEKPQKGFMETIKFTLQLSRGRMLPLVLFCVISYVIPGILSRMISGFGNSFVGVLITIILSTLISVFIAIFSFRFYQVYRQSPTNY